MSALVLCPVCDNWADERTINTHIDSGCRIGKANSTTAGTQSTSRPGPSTLLAPLFTASTANPSSSETATDAEKTSAKRRLPQAADTTVDLTGGNGSTSKRARLMGASVALRSAQPLAERLRPKTLDDFFGHEGLLSPVTSDGGGALRALILSNTLGSALLWGPPGTGKTTLAGLIALHSEASYHAISATQASVADVRKILDGAVNQLRLTGRRTTLFVDELHRFTKSQLDVFLPSVESGTIQLIGATSENPSFTINRALLSRLKVFALDKLSIKSLTSALRRGVRLWRAEQSDAVWLQPPAVTAADEGVPGIDTDMIAFLAGVADGDCRVALNALETALGLIKHRFCGPPMRAIPFSEAERAELRTALKGTLSLRYDRTGDSRYEMISALHKSVRGSDGGAAMYWLARMLTAGEDPLYISRRLLVVASEDVGLADNHALPLAAATLMACQHVGMPECRLNLAHLVAYLAEAPKSTRAYVAYGEAVRACEEKELYDVPINIRNAPTALAKELEHGKGYAYDPGFSHPVANRFLPPELGERSTFGPDVSKRFLQPEGSIHGKVWDGAKLREWELERNGGRPWEGRQRQDGNGGSAG